MAGTSSFHLCWAVLVVLMSSPGCDDSPPSGDAGPDADADTDIDAEPDGDGDGDPDADTGPAAEVLILDHELRHVSTWVDVIGGCERAGLTARYRRFYPHLTRADVEPGEDGQLPYSIVVVAAGRYPGSPGSQMRMGELDNARSFVEAGGVLVLVPQSGFRDSYTGENDFFLFNRLLEELEVPVRIDHTTMIGTAWFGEPSPPHRSNPWGYATPLEMVIGYPYLLTPGEDERIAGGVMPSLRVASDTVQGLLHTHDIGYVWTYLGGDPEERVRYLDDQLAAATLSRVGEGYLAVVPRGPLTLGGASSISDKPASDPEREAVNRAWVDELFEQLWDLARGQTTLEVTWTRDEDTLFSVAASNVDPLDDAGEVFEVASAINTLPVPEAPPEGELEEEVPDPPPSPRVDPEWFSAGGGRLGYGGLPEDRGAMAAAFAEAADHGIDVLMTTTYPSRLATLFGSELTAEREMYRQVAALAEDAGVRWYIGQHYVGPFLATEPRAFPLMVGSHGGEADSPAPLSSTYWEEVLLPICAVVGEVASENPGIAGFQIDMELYNGPVWHHDGWAFSDDTVRVFADHGGDGELAEALVESAPHDRLDLLIDAGRLAEYFGELESAAEDYGRRCRELATVSAPELGFMIYNAGFPNTWFHLGLMRGLATAENPVIVLTYDGWSGQPTETLWAAGVNLAHLGGAIVSYWLPDDFTDVLVSLARGNDGYWYFTFNDFSVTNPDPPPLHRDGDEYWEAVDEANALLSGRR